MCTSKLRLSLSTFCWKSVSLSSTFERLRAHSSLNPSAMTFSPCVSDPLLVDALLVDDDPPGLPQLVDGLAVPVELAGLHEHLGQLRLGPHEGRRRHDRRAVPAPEFRDDPLQFAGITA